MLFQSRPITHWGPLQHHALMLIAAWTSNQMPSKVCTKVSENGYLISPTYYNRCNSLSILGFQLIHMRKMVLWCFWLVVHEYAIMSLGSCKRSVMYSGEMNFIWPEKWKYLSVYVTKLVDNLLKYPKKYAHGFCFAVLCCGYTLTDFPISTRLTSLALWQSNDCPSASKATLMNMDKYFMWIHYERLHNHNKAKHNKTVCIFLGIYCTKISLHKYS